MSAGGPRAVPTVAVVGNPNTGKTTLFNALTGSRQRVGNWPGVTVERKQGVLSLSPAERLLVAPFAALGPAARASTAQADLGEDDGDGRVNVVDLPGIYALSASSEDEIIARDYVLGGEPDLVVNIVDASNLQRNLYLTLQLIETKVPVLVLLNMADLAEKAGIRFDVAHLAAHLGCPVVSVSSVRSEGVRAAREAIARALGERRVSPLSVSYPEPVERRLAAWAPALAGAAAASHAPARWVGLKLIEGDKWVTERVTVLGALTPADIERDLRALMRDLAEEPDVVLADARYGLIHGLTRHVVRRRLDRMSLTDRIDRVVMSRLLGVPVFLAVMYAVFWVTVSVGGAFVDSFDVLAGALFVRAPASVLSSIGAPAWVSSLVANGLGAGIQTAATFVPVIFLMFLMLAILEDSGYMARAAFVMDRVMRWIGLPGKAFVPMIVGFGCTVPAIMGTRTLDNARDRFMTIFMAPLMSCGARLPVYALFAAAFFPDGAGLVVFSIYFAGIVLAVLTGLLLKHTLLRGEVSHFVMELPPYHAPVPWSLLRNAGSRMRLFVVRAGLTITVVATILSVLNAVGTDGTFGRGRPEAAGDRSLLAAIGRAVTPLFEPMGIERDNWPATMGLFTGIFAKEVVVGTLASLYTQNAGAPAAGGDGGFALLPALGDAVAALREGLARLGPGSAPAHGPDGAGDAAMLARLRASFSPAGAYAYLLFVLIYFPCVSALAAAIREMGARYASALAVYLTLLAWSVATVAYQLAAGPRLVYVALPLLVLAATAAALAAVGRGRKAGA
jgi:ferrous iron transport protein B